MTAAPGQTSVLFFRARERLCALPLEGVLEILRPPVLRPAVNPPPFLLGAARIRGAVVPVVDAAVLLGAGRSAAPARLILLRLGARAVALAVEAVLGVRAVPRATLQQLPPLLRDAGEAVAAIAALDSELLLLLHPGRLLAGPDMEMLDAGTA
jgi:purine-binding chemotaxis protein CheW